ncbi:MAG: carboxypeptidase regulatory-like domain-containing protein, partial [Sedimentisphaerales bacterium]|nr:carboxypeptidase regulatory-like domain-containing protein [Sedimentisphaerales bacterium]
SFKFDDFAPDVSSDLWVKAPGKESVYKYTTQWTSSCGFEAGQTGIRLVLPAEVAIRGQVIDGENGNPVAGVSLLVQPNDIREHLNPYCPHVVVSGPDGQFSFTGIPAGKHLVKVVSPQKEMAKWVGKSIKVDVQPGQTTKDVTVEVQKGGIIETVVREGSTKEVLHNIRVSAHGSSYSFSADAWTGADGVARIRVPADQVNIYASADGYSYYRGDKPIPVDKGQAKQVEILLDRNPSASGIVLDESGQPVPGVLVTAHPFGDEALTGAAGRFKVAFDPSRPCECLFARYVERNLAAIADVRGDSKMVKITLKPALSIAGQVTDTNGVGIPAARLSLCVHITNCLSRFGPEVLADAYGRYQMRAIPPEQERFDYRISVNASGYGPKQYERVSITGEQGTPVEMKTIVLQPADRSISGVVLDAEGKPVAGVPIFLHGKDQPEKSTATDNDGQFTIKRICAAQLRLQANFGSSPGGAGFIEAEGGDRNVTIVLGQERVHKPYVSLVGKPLPELKDLGIELSPADSQDKMMLVCFWDMQQRPSRHCVTEVAKQAEQLKQKGVTIVAVQASKIDAIALKDWVEKYNITFPVGAVEGDMEKTNFAWGVRSLPWLILTNRSHTVTAEGFAVGALANKIKEITDAKL